jgi:hypothetical protein
MDQPDSYEAWLRTQDEIRQQTPTEVRYFAALEYDGRGPGIFDPILPKLDEFWKFRFDDGVTEIKTSNRLRRITMGQNLCSDYAVDSGATHMLFMAADCEPPGDAIVKLLEVDWPIVGGEVTTYCLSGPWVTHHPASKLAFDFPVQSHMATAAFVMLNRDLLKRLHWRYDTELGMSDDPCLQYDAEHLGYQTLVRKDCIGQHYPDAIPAIEERGHDMRLYPDEESETAEPFESQMGSAFEAKRWLMNVALANRGCQAVACIDQDAHTVTALFRATSDPGIPFTCSGHNSRTLRAISAQVPVACTLGGPVIHGPACVAILDPVTSPDWEIYSHTGARVLIVRGYAKAEIVAHGDYTPVVRVTTPQGYVVLYDKLPYPMPAQPVP